MKAQNYITKYKSVQGSKAEGVYHRIKATERWVEHQLDIYDMTAILMTVDFNTKMDLLAALTVAEKKRDYMYRHPNFEFKRATQLFNLVKNSPKVKIKA